MEDLYKKLEIDEYIIVDKYNLGKIRMKLWNGNGLVIKLENNDNFVDSILSQYKNLLGNEPANGFMLVTPNNQIENPNPDNLLEVINAMISESKSEYFKQINLKLNNNFNNFITNKLKTLFPVKIEQPQQLQQIIPINPVKIRNYKIQDMDEDNYAEYINLMIQTIYTSGTEVLYSQDNTSLNNDTNRRSIDLLSDDDINNEIKPGIKKILEKYNPMDMDMYYDYKNSLVYRHIILNPDDTISFGKQLINQIIFQLLESQKKIKIYDGDESLTDELNLFDFIKFTIVGNYLELTNRFESEERVINDKIIPGLNLLNEFYGQPIDYNILSQIILDNKTVNDVESNKEIIKEAIDIMSAEYLLCIQPKVEFLLWAIIRLICCWYSDPILYNNIYKIKILINLYRARGIKEFNKDTDVQPVILIYPKYGKDISRKVMSLLSYYFFPYKRFGWKESVPTYFNSLDSLMSYTNGSLELKRYIKFIIGQDKNKIFNKNLTKLNTGTDQNDIEYDSNVKHKIFNKNLTKFNIGTDQNDIEYD